VYYPDPDGTALFEIEAERMYRSLRHVTDALSAGVTALRVCGEACYLDVALRDAFAAGQLQGPRLFVSGPALKVTGGHGAFRRRYAQSLPAPVKDPFPASDPWGSMEVDGAEAFRHGARLNLQMGVNWIKLMITGGVAGGRERMDELQMEPEEIRAAVEAAHAKGAKVCAHLGGPDAVRIAVDAGVDCVEHGYWLDEQAVARMAERGTWLVPTLGVTQNESYMRRMGWPEPAIEKALAAAPVHLRGFQLALAAGVRIANGSDLHPLRETTAIEVEQLVRGGMTAHQAITAATRSAAEMCGAAKDVGTIEAGKLADLIVTRRDPLSDIRALQTVGAVIQNGAVVRNDLAEAAPA
jgi:imidazolonepropionase-like amidohydrolase